MDTCGLFLFGNVEENLVGFVVNLRLYGRPFGFAFLIKFHDFFPFGERGVAIGGRFIEVITCGVECEQFRHFVPP